MNKFKYIHNIADGIATLRIYKRIGSTMTEDGVNGSDFANEIAWLNQRPEIKKINIRINSGGGSVVDALAIQSSMINSAKPCDTYIDGIAASAGMSIAVSGRKCYMVDYGISMVHNVIDTTNKASKEMVSVFNGSVNTILTNRTKKTTEEITAMMEKETWMDAKTALANGMIDEIVSTEKKVTVSPSASLEERLAIYNELLTNQPDMKNVNVLLGLSESAAENAAIDAIKAKDTKIAQLEAKVTEFERKETEAKEAAKTALANKATELGNALETAKKIKPEEKAGIVAQASKSEEDYNFVKTTYDKVSNVKTAPVIFNSAEAATEAASRKDWDLAKWSKEDPKGLENLQKNEPEAFQKLLNTVNTKIGK